MRSYLITLVFMIGCADTVSVGVSGTMSNCHLNPGPEMAVGWAVGRAELELGATHRHMSTYDGMGGFSEMLHRQVRAEAALPVELPRDVRARVLAGYTWVNWEQTTGSPGSVRGPYWGLALDVGAEVGFRRERPGDFGMVTQWFVRSTKRF